jgi:hypothetical protein
MEGKKMARKKLSREERRRRRRKAIERKRRETGWEPPPSPSVRQQDEMDEASEVDEVFADMLPLFPTITDASASPGPAMEQLMMTLLGSGYMVDEPEFEEIIVDPMLCVDTFVEIAEESGIDPDSLDELSVEDREDAQMTILEETIQRLLTDELRQDILNGLNDLRLRMKQSGEREEAAKAAALQSFLGGDETQEIWPMIGLVQAIFYRSLTVGFELMEASMEVMETEVSDEDSASLFERVAQSRVTQKADALLKKVPGLGRFLEKQADKIWEEGLHALFMGELHLELFSEEELRAGFDILQEVFKDDIAERRETRDLTPLEMSEEQGATLISQVDGYLTEMMTPERLKQLRGKLSVAQRDPAYKEKWLAFLYMLGEYMADEDTVEYGKQFLVTAFLGEMHTVIQAFQEDAPLDEED